MQTFWNSGAHEQIRVHGTSISMSLPPGIESDLRLTTILPPKGFAGQLQQTSTTVVFR
jgi:hypothetical protein